MSSGTDVNPLRAASALFSGFVLASTLCGLTFFQTYLYFARFNRDPTFLRLLIGGLWILDTGAAGLLTESMYTYMVANLGSRSILATISETLCVEFSITVFTIFVVQMFLAYRVWLASGRNFAVAALVGLLAGAALAFGILLNIKTFRDKSVPEFFGGSLRLWASLHVGFALACDVLFAVALFACLDPMSNAPLYMSKRSIWDKIVFYTLNRGLVLVLVQTIYFCMYVPWPRGQLWMPFPTFIGAIHTNVMLSILNYRDSYDGCGFFEEDLKSVAAPGQGQRRRAYMQMQPAIRHKMAGSGPGMVNVNVNANVANASPAKRTADQELHAHGYDDSPVEVEGREGELGRMRFAVRSFLSMGSAKERERESVRESTHSDTYGLGLGLNIGLGSLVSSFGSLRRSRRITPIDFAAANGLGAMETVSEGEEGRALAEKDGFHHEHPFARAFHRGEARQSANGSAVMDIMTGYAY